MRKLIRNFDDITLEEMDSVKLMNRHERKYTVSYDTLSTLLNDLKDDYYVLEIGDERVMPYESVYYDKPDFTLYTTHQNGKQNRYKVRSRTYALTGDRFLELKFKNNKKRTIKRRIPLNSGKDIHDNEDFLVKHLPFSTHDLEEKIEISYNRITLVDKKKKERVTIDMDLSYSTENGDSTYNNLAIIEIKFEGNIRDSIMNRALKSYRIKPLSFSKYCLGISQHFKDVKQNNMNIKLREINKKLNEEIKRRA